MPDPLPAESSRRVIFAEYVQKYTHDIYTLSSMLLQQSAEAEKVTIRTFKELHKIYRQKSFDRQLFSTEAYRLCIRQCADYYTRRSLLSPKALPWEEQLVKVMWYGLKLSLHEISNILQKSVPVLKDQLRRVREQMTAPLDLLPSGNLSVV
ncbi:RNA polymerase sigma factor SigW [compost metagenome]